jgi:hypothetical protein
MILEELDQLFAEDEAKLGVGKAGTEGSQGGSHQHGVTHRAQTKAEYATELAGVTQEVDFVSDCSMVASSTSMMGMSSRMG